MKVLEMDNGGGCTTVGMGCMLENCTLKSGKNGAFILCILSWELLIDKKYL